MTITIYHAEARRSERVAWLLEEMGIHYDLIFTPGDVIGSFTPLRETGHGFPMAPMVRDREQLLIESAAILETLMNRYGDNGLRPATHTPEHAIYLEWLHFAESSAFPRFQQEMISRGLPPAKTAEAQARREGGSKRVLAYIENRLAESDYLAGDLFTAADIQMHFVLRIGLSAAAERRGTPAALLQPDAECFAPWPSIAVYMKRLGDRPAFQRAMARSMPRGFPAI